MALSDTGILELKPTEKPYKVRDSEGLYLEVRPTGARLWRYRYRLGGKENMYAIGAHPEVKVVDARRARDEARRLVRQGINPSHHRKEQEQLNVRRDDGSFEAVAREWLDSVKQEWSERTQRQRERLFEKDIFPEIGATPMREVTREQGLAVIQKIEKRSPRLAQMALRSIAAVSQMAVNSGHADTELVYRNALRSKPAQRRQPLKPDEIAEFFRTLAEHPSDNLTKGAIQMLWLTLARPKEILQARWWEFDLAERLWVVPSERMALGRPHRAPLPSQAVALLEEIRTVSGGFEHVFPNRTDPTRHASHSLLTRALQSMGYRGKLNANVIRLTGRSILVEQGFPVEVIDRQLAHVSKKNTQIYYQGDL
ncbi:MAG: integrase arm-type DNA-binding domain-containing protein, partial [Gammaproteobacteria bacterium]